MRSFCGRRIGAGVKAAHHLFEILTCVFEPQGLGLQYRGELPLRNIQALFLTMTVFWWDRGTNFQVRKEGILCCRSQTGYFLTG